MAPNGGSGRKTPAPAVQRTAKMDSPFDGLFDDLEDSKTKLEVKNDVKKALPSVKKPGNWDSEVNGTNSRDGTPQRALPVVSRVPSPQRRSFPTSRPMRDNPDLMKCNHCKRAVSRWNMPRHIEGCLNKKQEKQRKKKEAKDARDAAARREKGIADSEDEDGDEGKENIAGKTGGLTGSKKRKAGDGEDEGGPPNKKKKKKDGDKPKGARPKAPVDVEKQCGVELPQGGQCARSLTCKSHSMGAKRAVPGRSKPYDQLLAEYQRKNIAKQQKAAMDANAENLEDEEQTNEPLDWDKEKDDCMAGIQRTWGGAPLYEQQAVPIRARFKFNKIKASLAGALSGRGNGIFGGSGGGGGGFFGTPNAFMDNLGMESGPGPVHARRGSVVPGARSMMAPIASTASRKQSLASAGA